MKTFNLKTYVTQFTAAYKEFFVNITQMIRMTYQAAPGQIVAYFGIQVLQGFLMPLGFLLLKLVLDMVGAAAMGQTTATYDQLMLLLFGLTAVTILNHTMQATDQLLNSEISRRLTMHVNRQVYSQFLRFQGLKYFESPQFHDTVRASQRMHLSFTLNLLSYLVTSTVQTVSFMVVLLALSPGLALVLIATTIPSAILLLRYHGHRYYVQWNSSPQERKSYYLGSLLSEERYAKEIRLFNLGSYFLDTYIESTVSLHDRDRKLEKYNWRVETLLNIFQSLVLSGAILYIISQALQQLITVGDVLLYIETIRNVQSTLETMINQLSSARENTLFFRHYLTLMNLEPDIAVVEPRQSVPPLQQGIELRNLSFRYTDDGPPVLDNVNLMLHKGECLALVGLNGAGKSTLVKLLSRFYEPTGGEILWDGIDIKHFDPQELRNRMGAVFQDFMRYDLTARENIGLGHVADIENHEKVEQVARDMHVDEFIKTLPRGYETVLSRWLVEENEKGTNLSGGQWQKIAIARMNMREADFVMLDEPTAALDAEAEYEIFLNFAKLVKDRTSLLISHRFSTVRMADRIAVLEEGRIQEYGTHTELIQKDALYARLYRMQAEQYMMEKASQNASQTLKGA